MRVLEKRVAALTAERDRLQASLKTLLGSRPWRLLQRLRRVREKLAPYGTRRARLVWYAIDTFLRWPKRPERGAAGCGGLVVGPRAELQRILAAHPQRRGVVVYPPLIDWGWMKQRPHQLVKEFARAGYLVFYCPPQSRVDYVGGFTPVAERIYLCGCIEWLYELADVIVLMCKPQHWQWVRQFRRPIIIYDYLDELAIHAPDGRVRAAELQLHRDLLQRSAVVCATAERLLADARRFRTDALFCPNAAEFEHFHLADPPAPPADLDALLARGRPIVGYYGALAEWFDFELLEEVARRRADLDFVLIGPDYDGSLARYAGRRPANVFYLGEKRYEDLPDYLHYFDVATIPFRVNDITRATSPIKLFEYMAAGKPIVTTPLPECQRHARVLIADGPEAFAARLDEALQRRRDAEFVAGLVQEARANGWGARFAQIEARLVPADVRPLERALAHARDSRGAIVFPPSIDWNVELFQRPQHLARAFAQHGYTVVYCGGARDGHYRGVRELAPGLFLQRGPLADLRQLPDPLLWLYCYNFELKDEFGAAARVVYDLIDEPAVHPFPRKLLIRKHARAVREATAVTYVARRLERLLGERPDALYLPNGVEYERFAGPPAGPPAHERLQAWLQEGRPIAGYYGALARWLDYDLLIETARRRADWGFVMIGPNYDNSLPQERLAGCPNICWIGPQPYPELPRYLQAFAVALIPFQINAITKATSPLKLYEYFAAGKPVITTALPECMAFPDVRIVRGAGQFAAALDAARVDSCDPVFQQSVQGLARANDWARRVAAVEELLAPARVREAATRRR